MQGGLIASLPTVKYGLLYTSILDRHKLLALIENELNYNSTKEISDKILKELQWQKLKLPHAQKLVTQTTFLLIIHTDASDTGQSATDGQRDTYGFWSSTGTKFSINYKELLAIKQALLSLAKVYTNNSILLRVDNTTALFTLIKWRTFRTKILTHQHINIFTSCIQSLENKADALSHITNIHIKWSLN